MAIRKIAQIGHPVLRRRARELARDELASPALQQFIDDLVETMRDADGAGLAAIQVYEPIQICAIEVGQNPRYPYKPPIPLTILVNPVLTPVGDETFGNYEGCLSVPNLRGVVTRSVHVHVRAWDRHGNSIDEVVHGLKAGTYQHEVDHLNGTIFVDITYSDEDKLDLAGERYEPFGTSHLEEVLKQGVDLDRYTARLEQNRLALERFLNRHGGKAEDYAFLPLTCRYRNLFLALRRADGSVVDGLEIDKRPPAASNPPDGPAVQPSPAT